MKSVFHTSFKPSAVDLMLLILRIVVALFMLKHGYSKVTKYFAGGDLKFADPLGIGVGASLFLAAFSEFFCSIFVLIGLATRLAVIPIMITMSVASFVIHWDDGLSKMELPLMFILVYSVLLVLGSGKYSIDHLIKPKALSNPASVKQI
jgi:putative oxidoreductase